MQGAQPAAAARPSVERISLLAGVFAIQLTILIYGWGQDLLMSLLKDSLCPYSGLGKERGPA